MVAEALNQGRYTWKRDSVLTGLVTQVLLPRLDVSTKMFAYLPAKQASESPVATIPTNISTTTFRPDPVLISKPEIAFLELTVPSNSPEALAAARS